MAPRTTLTVLPPPTPPRRHGVPQLAWAPPRTPSRQGAPPLQPARRQPAGSPPRTPIGPIGAPPKLTRRSSSEGRLMRQLTNQVEMRYKNLREAFRRLDLDCSGGLSREELEFALQTWRIPATPAHVDAIMAGFDCNGDASISFAEWCDGIKQSSMVSRPVFGRADQHVTNHYSVLSDGRVIVNDNLARTPPPNALRSAGRPDFEAWTLPTSAQRPSPQQMKGLTSALQDQIYVKYKLLRDAFRSFDKDKDGMLSHAELLMAVRCFNLAIPEQHVLQLARECDKDGNGFIDYNEFANVLKRKDALGN